MSCTTSTCYLDESEQLRGVLCVRDGCVIDFDRSVIVCDGQTQEISATYMKLIEKLIVNAPAVVEYETLFRVYYGDRYYDADVDKQVLRNFKTRMKPFITIVNRPKLGYCVQQDFGIGKRAAVIVPVTDDCRAKALQFSTAFFHDGAAALADEDERPLMEELDRLSRVYDRVARVVFDHTSDDARNATGIVRQLYHHIVYGCRHDVREVLKIKGPLGSYKNRIMQYLYLAVYKTCPDVLPFYIDLARYEKQVGDHGITTDEIVKAVEKDIGVMQQLIAESGGKMPLLMIDGIRDFSCGKEALYYAINDDLIKPDCKLVVCVDSDFTINPQHTLNMHPLAANTFAGYARLSSLDLCRREDSIGFIRDCVDVFDVSLPDNMTADKIYDALVDLGFGVLDAYWLVYVLSTVSQELMNPDHDIADIYTAMCMELMESHKRLDAASQLAYEFEFGSAAIDDCFDDRWCLMRKHRSVLDFLVAREYVARLAALEFKSKSRREILRDLEFFNMVMQKNITRFVVAMIKGVDDYEHKIMTIARKYYSSLSLFGKSELTFWMARLEAPKRQKECLQLLSDYREQELKNYRENQSLSLLEKRDAAFLLRGICVSLIHKKDKTALTEYLESLISDKIANSVNRGFHLEYYGDKPYTPSKTLLDYEDDVTTGGNTMATLCLSLDRRVRRKDLSSYVALLEVVTLCNLIQARIECDDDKHPLDVMPYVPKCIGYIERLMRHSMLRSMPTVAMYLMCMHSEFGKRSAEARRNNTRMRRHRADIYNEFSDASSVRRTGWLKRYGIEDGENIVEHMYNCWLVGMMYLPEQSDAVGYDKQAILQMLLIHDLGETKTGDTDRAEKRTNPSFYDHNERLVMHALFLSGTYPSEMDMSAYLQLWNTWDRKHGINYAIAKEIDNIQTIYRFCRYYLDMPDRFTEEDVRYWLGGLSEIETDVGKHIVDALITDNPLFTDIVAIADTEDL